MITKKGAAHVQVVLLFLSMFAFAFVLSEGLVLVGAVELMTSDGKTINADLVEGQTGVYRSSGVDYNLVDGKLVRVTPQNTRTTSNAFSPTGGGGAATSTAGASGDLSLGAASVAANAGAGGVGGSNQQGAAAAIAPLAQLGGLLTGTLGESLIWGGVVFGVATVVSPLLGFESEQAEAIGIAAGLGTFAAKMAQGFFQTDATTSIFIGAAVGLAAYYLLYEKVKFEAVSYACLPYQSPIGVGQSTCEQCNDPTLPCSEYRCKSLGQNCELVNAGTEEERCINVHPKDVVPPIITPNATELTFGYRYLNVRNSPPGPGFEIIRSTGENGCVEAFTPLRFGVSTDEPSQCKIDFKSTSDFASMYSFMGGSNLFRYDHYEQFVLPHASDFSNTSLQLTNGKDLTFFIRCQDKNGNFNDAEYAIDFCIDPSPDTTAPQVKLTSVEDTSCIAATTDSAEIEFYVNEPAQCRFSRTDQAYELMENDMSCDGNLFQMNALQLFTCRANLTGVTKDLTDFYVRCEDGQDKFVNDRNRNAESYRFSLRGSTQLKMRKLIPNTTDVIYGGVSPLPVNLQVETLFGCERGAATCSFSSTGEDGDYVLFAETDTEDGIHNQTLFLPAGDHRYDVQCVDSGGNLATDFTEFNLNIDTTSPIIARIYNDADQLKVVTLRESQCRYSTEDCDFLFEEGITMPRDDSLVHFADWDNSETYHIKCRDAFRDLTADCSAIVRPTTLNFNS
ncbi:MAG: hypothetical protein ACI83O_000559 [Patescibacteria group bacterium]|jgi:hypothetical protein